MSKKKAPTQPEAKVKKEQSPFAKFVVGYRMVNGLSQRDLAEKLKIAPSIVAIIESDKHDLPISFFARMIKHLEPNEAKRVKQLFYDKIDSVLEG